MDKNEDLRRKEQVINFFEQQANKNNWEIEYKNRESNRVSSVRLSEA